MDPLGRFGSIPTFGTFGRIQRPHGTEDLNFFTLGKKRDPLEMENKNKLIRSNKRTKSTTNPPTFGLSCPKVNPDSGRGCCMD